MAQASMGSNLGAAVLGLFNSQLGPAIIGSTSLNMPAGYTATTPMYEDYTVAILSSNNQTNPQFGNTITFNLPKNSTMIGRAVVELTIGPAQTNVAFDPALPIGVGNQPTAEYVKNLGDLLCENLQLVYGTTNLQSINGKYQPSWRRICKNDVNIEYINAMVLGNLSPGGSSEQVLIDAFYGGCTVYIFFDELFFVNNRNEFWMPEAYALEGQLKLQLATLDQVVCTSSRTSAELTGGAAVRPVITNCILRYQEDTLSAAEKSQRLKFYRTPEGLVQHFLDLEYQLELFVPGSGARAPGSPLALQPLRTNVLQLGNIRMDMAEILFCVHRISPGGAAFPEENGVITSNGWGGSWMEGDVSPTLVVPTVGTGFSTLIDVETFQVSAAGKSLTSGAMPGFWNRSIVRKTYHPDAQIVGAFYSLSFAKFPEDRRNATGHISASVAGNLALAVTTRNPGVGIDYRVDVYVHSHNLMQSRGGSIGKASN